MHDTRDAYLRWSADVVAELGTDGQLGLSDAEADARLRRVGPNVLAGAPPVGAWRRFVAQLHDALVLLLLAAATLSTLLWVWERETALPVEALAIVVLVLLDAGLGVLQETRAEAAVSALRALSAQEATVVRSGARRRVPAAQLVPGDLLRIEEGDTIPADARLVESVALLVGEAPLTGESVPVAKRTAPIAAVVGVADRDNMLFSGTAAVRGRGIAVVTATAMQTEMGHVAGLLERIPDEPTPLQRELARTGRLLGSLVIGIAVVMVATIVLVQRARGVAALMDVFLLGVALAVAAVPEGLPAVVTTVLALGVQRMARRHAIVRRLAAVETLGSATVIAADKTGTLTSSELVVQVVVTASGRFRFHGPGYAPDGAVRAEPGAREAGASREELEWTLRAAEGASNAVLQQRDGHWSVRGDPTEGALLAAARRAGIPDGALDADYPRVGELPFTSERKRMSTLHRVPRPGGGAILFTKGAPDVLLAHCSAELCGGRPVTLGAPRRVAILAAAGELAGTGLRTLGVALRMVPEEMVPATAEALDESFERDLAFAGLIGMIDPPRDTAREAVARARAAGIRPLLITGDHPRTALAIARELGIADDRWAVTGGELDELAPDALRRLVGQRSVYARVSPEHKLRIVEALRRAGAIVVMTGDGVNDAPALRAADIGVAMGRSGTDVARQAADMVLADDDFATIVAAVEEGRAIFANIRRFLRYLLSSNVGEVASMFLGVVLAGRLGLRAGNGAVVLPLLATQILWMNFVTDGAPALALGMEPAEAGLMRQPPRPSGEAIITRRMWLDIGVGGGTMALSALYVLDASLPGGLVAGAGDVPYARTMAFTTLVLAQLLNALDARSDTRSAFVQPFRNRWLWGALGLSLLLQAAVVHLPALQRAFGTVALGAADWLRAGSAASAVLWVGELRKLARRRLASRAAKRASGG